MKCAARKGVLLCRESAYYEVAGLRDNKEYARRLAASANSGTDIEQT
jgi:hypothetical protein